MAWAARSLARIATKAPNRARPETVAARAALVSDLGSPSLPAHSMTIATIGSAIRARVFQTPVTMAEVDTSRFWKPQDRRIV